MTTATLAHGDTIQMNGVYGLVGVVRESQWEDTRRVGGYLVWAYVPDRELSTPGHPIVKGALSESKSSLLLDRQLVIVSGRFYRLYFQRGSKVFADFAYFEHVLPHINLNRKPDKP